MSGRIQRGWLMAKASFAVLKEHPRLLILPAVSAAALLGAFAAIFSTLVIEAGSFKAAGELVKTLEGYWDDHTVVAIIALFAFICLLTAISVFFNAALVFCAL